MKQQGQCWAGGGPKTLAMQGNCLLPQGRIEKIFWFGPLPVGQSNSFATLSVLEAVGGTAELPLARATDRRLLQRSRRRSKQLSNDFRWLGSGLKTSAEQSNRLLLPEQI